MKRRKYSIHCKSDFKVMLFRLYIFNLWWFFIILKYSLSRMNFNLILFHYYLYHCASICFLHIFDAKVTCILDATGTTGCSSISDLLNGTVFFRLTPRDDFMIKYLSLLPKHDTPKLNECTSFSLSISQNFLCEQGLIC